MKIHDKSPPRCWTVGLAILCIMLSATWASALSIDEFTDGDVSLSLSDIGSTSTGVAATSAIGGWRDVTLVYTGDLLPDDEDVAAASRTGSATRLTWNNGDTIFGNVTLLYDDDGSGLGGVDLTDGGASNLFLVTSSSGDGSEVYIKFTVIDTSTASSSVEKLFLVTGSGISSMNHFIPFADLTGTADLTDIDSIEVVFRNTLLVGGGGDYKFNFIGTAVPEPLSLTGLFMGLGGLANYIRKRRMA